MGNEPFTAHDTSEGEGERRHFPVMLPQVLAGLSPDADTVMVDATFGAGGYTRALLEAGSRVVAIDRDPTAIEAGQRLADQYPDHLTLNRGRFSALDAIAQSCGHDKVDGVVADIGVSSMQIDQAERGFSFMQEGPLDMRMEMAGPSAADVVNTLERQDLTRIIGILGDERRASHISAEIVKRREKAPFETTLQLAKCVEDVIGRKAKDRIHPATRTFQALRIFVNQELDELANALLAAERILKPGGRLVIVSFHSLEDRLVKRFLQDRSETGSGSRHLPAVETKTPTFILQKRGVQTADDDEVATNVRSRSAKLRTAVRTDAEAGSSDRSVFGLPRLAELKESTLK
ncbi:MAG: 16S rRNA (cytosine(1402)-N(4))-methyltransferase RsmH [Pseudomonadota bacterium]